MFSQSVSQDKNSADKVIGRDDNSVNNTYLTSTQQAISAIADMYLRILDNSDQHINDDTYEDVKESLFRYRSPKSDIKDLSTKLKEADRAELIEDALELKESTIKLMTRYEASNSGQFILVHILSTIASKHKAFVVPAIKGNLSRTEVDAIIDTQVIGNALEILNGTNRSITSEKMYGLMYYLAGNCHIKWTI
ncbi:ABC-three component system protein [Acinetobacter sp. TY1]|uniref:ABC-three component system protein n=1 Tax=Acinetobacter sp. TY1 TaxID=3387626 RepID=UPI003AF91C5C